MEQKAQIDNAIVSEEELQKALAQFGFEALSFRPLRGGFSSCNLCCEVRRTTPDHDEGTLTLMLKLANEEHSFEDINLQVLILSELQKAGFPTNYPHRLADASGFIGQSGKQFSLLLDFVKGIPGDKLVAARASENAGDVCTIMRSLGATLAQLHMCELAKKLDAGVLRGIRSGFPVSNTGDLLLPGKAEAQLASPLIAGHPMAQFVLERLSRFRSLYEWAEGAGDSLPVGLIHGDAFLDNTLFDEENMQLAALVDWEDACVAPLVLDVAVCMAGNCFNDANKIDGDRISAVLEGYTTKRPLSKAELASVPDFLWAAVLACGAWRFVNFNVEKADSPEAAKESYVGMKGRVEELESMDMTELVKAAASMD